MTQTQNVQRVFEALASVPRRKILALLSQAELSTTELARQLSMSAPTMSRHLSILEAAGLVTSARDGQYVLYSLVPASVVNTLTQYAFELCPVARPLKKRSKQLRRRPRAA